VNLAPARVPCQSVNQVPAEESAGNTRRAQGWIDLWHADLQHTDWRRLLHLLSDEEHRRADAYAFDRDARRFIVSRAVLRTLLSRFTSIPACELRYRVEREGKPVLESGMGPTVHFSLSRSEELVLIGFAPCPLGLDIEWLGQAVDVEALVDRCSRGANRRASGDSIRVIGGKRSCNAGR
jgi:phosphopantetheinyl transferase